MLSERDRAVLDFEASWWLHPGPKEVAIREQLDMSATRYYQVLNRLLEDEHAMEYDPLTVLRVRKLRDRLRHERVEDRLAGGGSGPQGDGSADA